MPGRARHAQGVMIAMLDQKLLEQEQRNNFKEKLMYEALSKVRGMLAAIANVSGNATLDL